MESAPSVILSSELTAMPILTHHLGGHKSLTVIRYADRFSLSPRHLPSDALALHHDTSDLLYAGLRNSMIILEDLRVPSGHTNVVASSKRGKAVIGVKRVKDSAVPWGLITTAMGDEVSIICHTHR